MIKNIKPYNKFQWQGDQLYNASVDYAWIYKNLHLFGETAISGNRGKATLNGLLISLDPRADFSILYRYFDKNYQSLYAQPFAEGTRPENEEGIYTGLLLRPKPKWEISVYADIYRFPWLRYQVDFPSHGEEYSVQVNHRWTKTSGFYLRAKYEVKKKNDFGSDQKTYAVRPINKSSIRIHLDHQIAEKYFLRSRVELSAFHHPDGKMEQGFFMYQDLIYRHKFSRLSAIARFALFETESYYTRIYSFENDVLYHFYIPAFQGNGSRYYLVLRYKFSKKVDSWIKFAQTFYRGKDEISSGWEKIDGSTKTSLTIQMRVKF